MKSYKLSSVVEIISGGTPKTTIPEYWNGDIGWLSVADFANKNKYVLKSEKTITKAGLESSSTKILKVNDIIISARGTVGELAMLAKPMAFNQSCFGLRTKSDCVEQNYLFYYLKNYMKNIKSKTQGSVFETINLSTFDMLYISFPDIKVQEQISFLLSKIDNKIEISNKINYELESLSKNIYDYWFLQFEFPNEAGKPYKSSGGKMVWNDELKREIPEYWEVSKFDDIVDNPPSIQSIKAPDYKNVGKYPIIDQAEEYISGRTENEYYVFENNNNCVVFGDVTKYFKYVNFSFAKGTDGTKIIQSKNNRIPALLLYFLIKDIKLPNIGFARHYMYLREIKIIVPPVYLCQKFNNITKPFMNLKKHSLDEIYELKNLRDFLLPLLMNGQVTVKGSKM